MTATKSWSACACGCGSTIEPGTRFHILEGNFLIEGHETRNALEEADIMPQRDYSRMTARKTVEQKPLEELPLFGKESPAEQLTLF